MAQTALKKAKYNELNAVQDLNQLKVSIAELESTPMQPKLDIPPQVLAGVAVLQHAGLQPEYLNKVGCLLGATTPPPPPEAPPDQTPQPE